MITFSPLFIGRNMSGGTIVPPIYNFTEDIIFYDSYYWVENSAQGITSGHGKLYKSGDISWSSADVTARYAMPGTIDLSPNGDYWINTGWIAPTDEEWSISGIYNVVMGVSYDGYTIRYKGDGTCDIYIWSSTKEVPLVPTYSDIAYTPPVTNLIIYDEPPSVIFPTEIEYTMGVFNTV